MLKRGVYAASLSVLNKDLTLNVEATISHAENLIKNGLHGCFFFGSTGMSQLISKNEKMELISKISTHKQRKHFYLGTGCNSLNENIELIKYASEFNFNTILLMPSAYYVGNSDEGVFEFYKKIILAINHLDRPVVSVDLPSGLNVDTGKAMGLAVRAHVTVTFAGLKQGLLTGDGKEFAGEIVFDNLDIPDFIFTSEGAPEPSSERIDINYVTPVVLGEGRNLLIRATMDT